MIKKITLLILFLTLINFNFSQVEITYKSFTSYDDPINSISFLYDDEKFLEIECDAFSICSIFNATSYEVIYEGNDGIINENSTLQYISFKNTEDTKYPNISLPNYNDDVIGFVKATAGYTGHGTQTLYLININTGQWTSIYSYDMIEPQWYYKDKIFGYMSLGYEYLGSSPNFPIGGKHVPVLHSIKLFDDKNFNFIADQKINEDFYKKQISEFDIDLSIIELFADKSIHEISDIFDDNSQYDNELEVFIKYIYYSRKLGNFDDLMYQIFVLLDEDFLDYYVLHKFPLKEIKYSK